MIESPCKTSGSRTRNDPEIPRFEPHPWCRGAHAQTIAGRYLNPRDLRLDSVNHDVDVDSGDRLRILKSVPPTWKNGDPAALLVHGLASCARAPYMVRFARRLLQLGVLVVRMNLRGAGDGFGLARGFYHAGRSEDLRAVVSWMAARFPGSPIALVGFSLGGNLALKLAAEASEQEVVGLDCVLAANPPIDLAACAGTMRRPLNQLYGWNFAGSLVADVKRLHRLFPELGKPDLTRARSVFDFDDRYTAPRNGFASAQDYYSRSSVWPLIPQITLSGLVVHAQDDPFIPADSFARVRFPANLPLELTRHGGHMGYLSRNSWLGDHRWLDARLATWLAAHWGISTDLMQPSSSSREWGRTNHEVHIRHV